MSTSILDLLPQCYRSLPEQKEIALALTHAIAELFDLQVFVLSSFEQDYLDPASCKEEWLDVLAYWGGWGQYWDARWAIAVKRDLLANTPYLWANRGNQEVLPLLFTIFNLDAYLKPDTGFILLQSFFPGNLNADPFSYKISVPSTYPEGSPEYNLIVKLIELFLPCWVEFQFEYR